MKKLLSLSALVALLSLPALAVPFTLDTANSKVDFAIKHLKLTQVDGKFTQFSGTIDFDIDAKQLKVLNGEVEVASVDTDNQKRDDHLRAPDIFDAQKYPKITFTMTKAENNKIYGDLTIRDKTKSITLDAKQIYNNGVLQIEATSKIKRSDFDVVWESNLQDSLVGDDLTIKLNLIAKQ
ncbi:MAG: YceI family protein [Helicobacter sp.]|nr:YceI family protein [Helicobacter sp.]